jgi:diguanylate cyclase (GGDEF)-like protein
VAQLTDVQDIALSLRGCMKAVFPPVLAELIGEALKDDPDFKTMARIIGMDPALAATTLSLVNAPFYGLTMEVVDLERAAVVLGNKEILKLALSVSFHHRLNDRLRGRGKELFDNWSLVIWSASASQLLAERLCPELSNQAYLCTLLKDISLLTLCSVKPEIIPGYPSEETLLCLRPGQLEQEHTAWGMDHCWLSVEMLKEWDFPLALCPAIAHHHDFHTLEGHDALTQTVILATKWAEVEHQARTNPGLLIQFKSLLGMILGVGGEELSRLRSICIEQYKAFSGTFLASNGQFESQVRINEIPLDDLQYLYLMSLDLQNAGGGLNSVAEIMARHLKLSFAVSEWELALLNPLMKGWVHFSFKDGSIVSTRSEVDSLADIPWAIEGASFKLAASGKTIGKIMVPHRGMGQETRQGMGIYVQLISQSFEHYLRNHAVIERKALTLDLLPLGVARLDTWGAILDANEKMLSFLDSPKNPVGRAFWSVLGMTKGLAEDSEWQRFLQDPGVSSYTRVICPLGPESGMKNVCFYISAHRSEDKEGGVLVMVEDITEITDLQSEAIKQREYLENLLRSMQDIVLTVDSEGQISFSSSPDSGQLVGRNFFEITSPLGTFTEAWGPSVLRQNVPPHQISLNPGNGELKPLEIVITPLKSFENSYMIVGRDLSTIIRLEEKIKRQAVFDHLTNVFNRHQFQIFLSREVERSQRDGTMLGVIFFDIDRLKEVNDQYGHAAGDALLKEIGRLLQKGFRRGMDYPCRFGGDEFVILLTGLTSPQILEALGERLLLAARAKFKNMAGLSLGLAIHKEGEAGEEFVRRADHACYQAKVSGGNRIVWSR